MAGLHEVHVGAEDLERFASVIGEERTQRLLETAARASAALAGRRVWNVNSTASGGGVAEMLQVLVSYARGAGVDARWLVVPGSPEFFAVTKRLHNLLHGDGAPGLPEGAREEYDAVSRENGEALAAIVRSGDIVLLHDPQTAGMVDAVREAGALVVWRSHIGTDRPDAGTKAAWRFLRPALEGAHGYVFSREQHIHPWMDRNRVTIIPPSIDPFAPKNQPLEDDVVLAILACTGLVSESTSTARPSYVRRDGSPASVTRRATLVRGRSLASEDAPLVVQVSRWDRLKDMTGVLRGFAEHVPAPGELALVGPSVEGVTDDPEGPEVLQECAEAWDDLPSEVAARIRLVSLPMDDVDENAAMVNAIQRHASVVVQKSLQEGFGLTVSEAMIKRRPVVASRIGGIRDQIEHDVHGLLVDPTDTDGFGRLVADLLEDQPRRARLGDAARARILERFVADRHLTQYAELFERIGAGDAPND